MLRRLFSKIKGWNLIGVGTTDQSNYTLVIHARCPHHYELNLTVSEAIWSGQEKEDAILLTIIKKLQHACNAQHSLEDHQLGTFTDVPLKATMEEVISVLISFQDRHRTPAEELVGLFPALEANGLECPVGAHHDRSVSLRLTSLIQHLNDDHEWSREKIADYIDTLNLDLTMKTQNTGD